MPRGVPTALHLHNQRVSNAIGGYGFVTSTEVRRILANAQIVDPESGKLVHAGGAVWIEDTPWHERGVLGQVGLGARGFADDLTMGFVSWVERKQGRLSPEEEEWLKNSKVHNAGAWVGFAGGLIIPGPGKLKAAKLVFGHGARHSIGTGLSRRAVQSTIKNQVRTAARAASSSK